MPEYLTVSEACDLARISRTTFYKLLANADSGLAAITIRIPGLARLRIPEQALREWLDSSPVKKKAGKARLRPCVSPKGM
jgi:excisionase family DNA binding protein